MFQNSSAIYDSSTLFPIEALQIRGEKGKIKHKCSSIFLVNFKLLNFLSFELQVVREREKELNNKALLYLKARKAQLESALTFLLSYQMKNLPLLFNFSCNFCLKESVSLSI